MFTENRHCPVCGADYVIDHRSINEHTDEDGYPARCPLTIERETQPVYLREV